MNDPITDQLIDDDSWEDAGTIDDLVRELLQESDETAHHYLRESWLGSVFALLRDTRRAAGLTQQELADQLGMKQSAIARLERAEDTKLSTVWKYLAACGQAPADLQTVSLEQLRALVLADPDAPRTADGTDLNNRTFRITLDAADHPAPPPGLGAWGVEARARPMLRFNKSGP